VWVIDKVKKLVAEFLMTHPERTARDVTIACFGAAFKPDIDDLRESPSLKICEALAAQHPGRILVVEPNISALDQSGLVLSTIEEAQAVADVCVLLVRHKQFFGLDFTTNNYIVDTQGLLHL
jgi:UDP-N-acetyl-D-mannosaminuronic acid dehydrogenase